VFTRSQSTQTASPNNLKLQQYRDGIGRLPLSDNRQVYCSCSDCSYTTKSIAHSL
jgi:hypothetical protein